MIGMLEALVGLELQIYSDLAPHSSVIYAAICTRCPTRKMTLLITIYVKYMEPFRGSHSLMNRRCIVPFISWYCHAN